MSGSVLTVSSRVLLDCCARLGLDTDAILAAAGVKRLVVDDPDGRLPTEQVAELWRHAYEASGDPDLALHAAELLSFGAYRVIDYLTASAPTVGVALANVSAYFPIINSAVRLPIVESADEIRFGIERPDRPFALTRAYVEYAFAAVVLRTREATGVRFPLEGVDMAFPRPACTTEHERIFGCEVRFDTERSAFFVSRSTWSSETRRADANLFGVLADHAQLLAEKVRLDPPPVPEVRRAIIEQLRSGAPSLEAVARQLAMSPRTLQRRLNEHGLSFTDVLDTTRAEAAKHYLRDREISVAEIAYLLGFADQSAFSHAFKRWTGETPNEYRRHG